ncbi:APOPT family protein CBG23705, mitochondrial-like [Varroa jacobsoni]|uniref:Uncharacterized protein n=1 Tax=Varroa destructor TaxID=109461 RepID=A0A7M7KNV2_VARDE|nr:APOPT family protein Y39B6A.34, mitochondrial-like [Varroa destructor]XP_022688977.1 APOPT family protein CBG23705, mitochondrial-like [Varroa jacobsoni]XP_022688978.1 APOPT family protein CBG23705, mitochondrial-like [Varroa jacobsoni]XP_022688979.1 APOPT family protein CBG23705, mitochondrial-like [Varroa jacobsoni]
MSLVRQFSSKLRRGKAEITKNPEELRRQNRQRAIHDIDLPRTLLTHTVVAPPHSGSNLRRIYIRTPQNETLAERTYREAYDDVQRWNQHYWNEHNQLFQQEKARFVMANSSKQNLQPLDAKRMAVFYKQFLNNNQKKHWSYNLEWYRRHFSLLPLEFRARLSRLKITFFGSREKGRKNKIIY